MSRLQTFREQRCFLRSTGSNVGRPGGTAATSSYRPEYRLPLTSHPGHARARSSVAPVVAGHPTPLQQQPLHPARLLRVGRRPADQLPERGREPVPVALPQLLAPQRQRSLARRSSKLPLLPDPSSEALSVARPKLRLPVQVVRVRVRVRLHPLLIPRLSLPHRDQIQHHPEPSSHDLGRNS